MRLISFLKILTIVLNVFLINAMQDNTGFQISDLHQQQIKVKKDLIRDYIEIINGSCSASNNDLSPGNVAYHSAVINQYLAQITKLKKEINDLERVDESDRK